MSYLINKEILALRQNIITAVRTFFIEGGYLEISTPELAPSFIPESTIKLFETRFVSASGSVDPLFLLPSPELWHKLLLSEGVGNTFEVCKCFRNSDAHGEQHNAEFTMLEWYTTGAGYIESIEILEKLFDTFAPFCRAEFRTPFERVSMDQLFRSVIGTGLADLADRTELERVCRLEDVSVSTEESWEELYHKLFLTRIEPAIPKDRPMILRDYPARINCLAKRIEGTELCERWELYAGGMEIANCFTEAVDQTEVLRYVEEEKRHLPEHLQEHISENFVKAFSGEYPVCSGVALGFDRLLMYLAGVDSIDEVLLFPFSSFF